MVNIISSDNISVNTTFHSAHSMAILADQLSHSITNIALIAIVFHIVWGAIFGFAMSILKLNWK
ncbi:MAG: hypothetical protein WAK17_23950 [Candidatus Nitrosopolaris sp.]|jgi:hypothetical protein